MGSGPQSDDVGACQVTSFCRAKSLSYILFIVTHPQEVVWPGGPIFLG